MLKKSLYLPFHYNVKQGKNEEDFLNPCKSIGNKGL